MKNRKRTVWLLSLLIVGVALTTISCKKIVDDTLQTRCENLLDDATDAATAFGNNPSSATCQDYVDAMNDYIDDCRTYAGYNQVWETYLASIDCSLYNY